MNNQSKAIAIVGIGAILPDALNPTEFWNNLLGGRYSITETPADRWSIADYYDADPNAPDKTYSKIGGWVKNFEFDWKQFKIPPRVVGAMDPAQQWAVTIAAQALADYGYPNRPIDIERTGVVLGTAMGGELHYVTNQRVVFPEYAHALAAAPAYATLPKELQRQIIGEFHAVIDSRLPQITEDSMPGELANIVSGRVANVLNLRGPNFITDAACASSLAALDAAFELLNEHEADAVITGGVDRNMGVASFVKFCKIGALSATGTRPFGKGADGFVMGEGCASFLVKRLQDAERDGDKIYAVVRGVGGSSDGKGKGITAPNPIGQQLATRRAWTSAGLDPATAVMVEAHGTSTRVGDVVEVESLAQIFGDAPRNAIALGSVKSNIGHLKAGAGAAGLLKAVLSIHHSIIPPTLNARTPNPDIAFDQTPFSLVNEPRALERRNNVPRRVGVSAYGFGGTNFHVVLEEHVPGMLTEPKIYANATTVGGPQTTKDARPMAGQSTSPSTPPRGILALGAASPNELKNKLDTMLEQVSNGFTPEIQLPSAQELAQAERIVLDFGDHDELVDRLGKARKAMGFDNSAAWKALQAQGIFRGSGPAPGKIAFLFPGQGSQYLNMGRALAAYSPTVQSVFDAADAVMQPILGKPLTHYIFADGDPDALIRAEKELQQTAITQPAMLTLDIAMAHLLNDFGFTPDMVMGHSLGEYAALIAAGIMPFADALEASAARGAEMTRVSMGDNGWMAAVMAPYSIVEQTLQEIDGYVVAANINGPNQSVIGGESKAVEKAIELFNRRGFQAQRLPVSHAFHTRIVAPASKPLRQVLDRLDISTPTLPLVANVTGEFYPTTVNEIKDSLEQQIASPVQWIKGIQTLYEAGVRTFVEVGPKKALKGLVDDILADKGDVISLFTNHPKVGELPTFNQALCGLYAAGYWGMLDTRPTTTGDRMFAIDQTSPAPSQIVQEENIMGTSNGSNGASANQLAELLSQTLLQLNNRGMAPAVRPYDRNETPLGSIVISGTGLGLPGAEKPVMDPDNAMRILRGEQFVDLIPERFRDAMLAKRVTRLVKSEDGSGRFETITNPDEVIKLAGRPGAFDLADEYGVPEKLVEALDITTQLAMAAGLDALREAGIPLVQTYKKTSKGTFLPERWLLPESLRDETGIIFASAFPGGDRFADEFSRYFEWKNREEQLQALTDLRAYSEDDHTIREIDRRINALRDEMSREPYEFDRRFLFRILAMGHSQFAEYIGARGPNTQVNAACASTTQAIGMAEDWIRDGRCRRVIVIAADNVTGSHLMEWVGAGFLATGAAATDDRVAEAALPFDRRRHGTLLGMGACALVIESQDAVRERGMRGIVEVLASETANSAYHGTRLDVNHIALVMNHLVSAAERRFGLNRMAMAPQMVFMSHETFTPARGGSAAAEVVALRETFGETANDVIVANTKGFTGHPMGVGIEDVIAVKILEYGIVPPVPNYREVDPDLGQLNLSRGGRYAVNYALHLAAGFGSQISMSLTRRIPGALNRVDNKALYQKWLDDASGYDAAETLVEKRVLRIRAEGMSKRHPTPGTWQQGTGPTVRVPLANEMHNNISPTRMRISTNELNIPSPASEQMRARVEPFTATAKQSKRDGEAALPNSELEVEGEIPKERAAATPAPSGNGKLAAVAQAPVAPAVVSAPTAPSTDPVIDQVLDIVAAKTGYPRDMLDLDLDMEADLGIDTVKQAETFAAIRETFDIPRQDNLKLRDYPTLKRAVEFVRQFRPDPSPATDGERRMTNPAQIANEQAPTVERTDERASPDEITDRVFEIVAAKTGYPQEMLDPDLDLEADLGIDTVKQAETFAAIREAFGIARVENLKLRDYPTLRAVIGFVETSRPDLVREAKNATTQVPPTSESVHRSVSGTVSEQTTKIAEPQPAVAPSAHVATGASSDADAIAATVLSIVAAKTGYPQEMLDLDLDMEADLGVDTVKQAETFAAVRQAFGISRVENMKLRDYPTLRHVVEFVRTAQANESSAGEDRRASSSRDESVPPPAPETHPSAPIRTIGTLEDADRIPRRVPTPTLRPPLDLCVGTGVTLDKHSRVIVMMDRGEVGRELLSLLQEKEVTTLIIDEPLQTEVLEARVKAWLSEGSIQGVYWLTALDIEPTIQALDLAQWRELNRVRVKNLYTTMRALYESIKGKNTFLISAARMGGLHGYGNWSAKNGASAPLGGAVTGFTKAFKRERGDVLAKAVDFEADCEAKACAGKLLAETLADPGVIEVGYVKDNRHSITLVETPSTPNDTGMELNRETVFVITGAAGGITSAITTDLAVNSGGTFYLLDLVAAPSADDMNVKLFRGNKEALKTKLIEDAKSVGEKPTPASIDKRILTIERQEAALRAREAVEAAGGTAYFYAGDLRDEKISQQVMDDIRKRHGKIDVIVHAAGVEISRSLADKEPHEFDLVFDVKADGFFNLLRAAQEMPISATVVFSSVAGRFGNNGQTDYSAANDLLCKITSSLGHWRPETRGIAIDWTAWADIGMATRGSIPKIMELAGISMLPAKSGVPTVRRELIRNDFRGEIVVAETLGVLTQEWHATGGLDTERVAGWLEGQRPNLAQIGRVAAARLYGGLEVETTLDPTREPYLFDHQIDNVPVLPGVMGTETFAELAQLVAPGMRVVRVTKVKFERPFKFHRMQPQTLYLSLWAEPTANGEIIAHAILKSVTTMLRGEMPPQEKIHFRADVVLGDQEPVAPTFTLDASLIKGKSKWITADQIYKIYFHGPAYRVLERSRVNGNIAIGELKGSLPPDTADGQGKWLVAPRLIELCFQTAGIWEIKSKHTMALPLAIESVCVYRQLTDAGNARTFAIVNAIDNGTRFDAIVVDESGAVYVKLSGYQTVPLPGDVELGGNQ